MKRLTSIFLLILFSFLSRSGMGQVANDRTFPEIRSFHIELQYSDGTKDTMALKPDAKKNLFADLNTEIKVKMHPGKLGREYGITLTGKQAKPLKYVDVNFIFANDFKGADLLYFQNSVVTNAWANVQKPSENDENSRELVLFKNTRTSRSLNIAFSSFNRFYTLFKTNKNHVLLRYFMEDKPLEPGKSYRLETFVVDNQQAGSVFYEQYAAWLGKRNPVKSKPVPGGWSSWSVYYGNIRQQQILNDAKFIADRYRKYNLNTIQIDDGWHGKSWGDWKAKEGNFSWGMKALADSMNRYGLTMGLWYAPTMFKPESDLFTNHPEYNIFYDGKIIKSFGGGEKFGIAEHNAFYSLDLSKPEVQKLIHDVMVNAVKNYHSQYFKLDFLNSSLVRANGVPDDLIIYPNDYAVGVFRKTMKNIRKAVGKDIFLVACGSPIGENIGIFDAMRISPDIIWEGYQNYWPIYSQNIINAHLRSYFHKRTFIIDPDALVIRDYKTTSDNCTLTDDEARAWTTAVAMSGGILLVNEEMNKLIPSRLHLLDEIVPMQNEAAKPVDLFEYASSTISYISIKQSSVPTALVSLYNLTDTIATRSFSFEKIGINGDALVFDCWKKTVVGRFNKEFKSGEMPKHSVEALLLRQVPATPAYLCTDANLFVGTEGIRSVYNKGDKKLTVDASKYNVMKSEYKIYIYVPKGYLLHEKLTEEWKDDRGAIYSYSTTERAKITTFNFEN